MDKIGNFTPSANSAPLPRSVAIDKPVGEAIRKAFLDGVLRKTTRGDLHARSDASQRHPVKRVEQRDGRPVVTTSGDEGGAFTVEGAEDVRHLQQQVAALIRAFEIDRGREPNAQDRDFWDAYGELIRAFERRAKGSPERAAEPLNATTPSTPSRRAKQPVPGPGKGETVLRKSRGDITYHVIEAH